MDLSRLIEDVKEKAGADTTANGEAHVQLLESIRKLNLAAETPAETLMRRRFEVNLRSIQSALGSCYCSHDRVRPSV